MNTPNETTQPTITGHATRQIEWSQTTYLGHLASLIDSNMTYLHSTLSWAVTVLIGGLAFIVTRDSFPDPMAYISILVMIPIMGHFAVRTGKAYLNVMRFSALEKHILLDLLNENQAYVWPETRTRILRYHCDWASPLNVSAVIYKLFFELGFIYFFGIVFGLAVYTLVVLGATWYLIAEFAVAIAILALEVWLGLVKSPYFRSVQPDEIARTQR